MKTLNINKLYKSWIKAGFGKKLAAISILSALNFANLAVAAAPSTPIAETSENLIQSSSITAMSLLENNYKTVSVTITAYSSTPDQTDDTPYLTAANTITRDGVVAANFLPFGTKIRIPELFQDKIFVVEDRMHSRFSDRVDIWFLDRQSAKNFGLRKAKIQIL